MTPTLSLVKHGDSLGDASTLSLYNFTDGWALEDDGWQQVVASDGDVSVVETFTLVARGSSQDDLAAKLSALDAMLQVIPRSRDAVQLYQLWLRVKMNTETGARQALILGAKRSAVPLWSAKTANAVGGYTYLTSYSLAMERMPYWESNSTPDGGVAGQMAGVSVIGGTANLYTVGGTLPSRLADINFYGDANAGNTLSAAINRIWMGVRTTEYGVLANFQPTWSLRKATKFGVGADAMDTTGGTTNADANTKDGYKTITTFNAHPELQRRVTIKTTAVTANPTDQRGTFLVLLRARLSQPGTVRVRLVDGLYDSTQFNVHPRVPVTTQFFQFHPLGTVQLPTPSHLYGFTGSLLDNYALGIDAERVPNTGGVSLEMDCLVLIPVDELLVTVDIGEAPTLVQATDFIEMGEWANGTVVGVQVHSSKPSAAGVFTVSGGLPTATGIIVLAADRGGYSISTDTDTVLLNTIRRYHSLRGAG